MKKIIAIVFCLFSLLVNAQNKVSKVILECTSEMGKFPVYQIEISDAGNIKYNGKRNVKIIGDYIFNVPVEKIKNLLGWTPTKGVDDVIQEVVEYYVNKVKLK